MLLILGFLSAEDLNSFAICSRRCREARSSPSLDQTRTGTIICSQNTSILKIYKAIFRGGWNNGLYSGNRTRLRVVSFERLRGFYERNNNDIHQRALSDDVQLTGVNSLDLSCSHDDRDGTVPPYYACYFLALILPNLRELDLSYMQTACSISALIWQFCENCPQLTRLIWNGAGALRRLYLDGSDFIHASKVTEVHIDCAQCYGSYSMMNIFG
jgi:hypothetical protein